MYTIVYDTICFWDSFENDRRWSTKWTKSSVKYLGKRRTENPLCTCNYRCKYNLLLTY